MKSKNFLFVFVLALLPLSAVANSWNIEYRSVPVKKEWMSVRGGYLLENPYVEFRGNILYYQGLGDSMMNHGPLFSLLTSFGYRVITFDYHGQGGSEGSMNSTTIDGIIQMGKIFFDEFARKGCARCDEVSIIGWSTGGLAAYKQAYLGELNVKNIVLLAPGIAPKIFVGEGLFSWPVNEISIGSLTSADYSIEANPHIDGIRPNTPIKALKFAANLISTAHKSKNWIIPSKVNGFVALSDTNYDTYVDSIGTMDIIAKNAPHFRYEVFIGARHEIDNERAYISNHVRSDILVFLLSNP